MLFVFLFILLGIIIGVFFGLVPGLHPNMIILLVPFFISLNIDPTSLVCLVVSIAITNTIVDFIPSILLGAPDSGNELSVMPGHRMLMQGHGYQAIKLTVIGSVFSVILCTILMPLIIISIPYLFVLLKPYTYILLTVIVLIMILSEEKNTNKLIALFCFLCAGIIGLLSSNLPIDNTLILFPLLSGLFGVSMLLLQINRKVVLPRQNKEEEFVSRKIINRSVILGSLGGIFSGLLPGVGSGEIASLASVDKNDKSFLVTNGAITTANILMSLLCLWLISKPRSGVAVVLNQLTNIGFNEFLIIIFTSIAICGIAASLTLFLSKKFINFIEKINYSIISKIVLISLVALSFIFTGFYGLFLLFLCTCLGIFTNLAKVRRSTLMGVLILPTILFYFPF